MATNYSVCSYTNGTAYTEVNDPGSVEFVDVVQGFARRRFNFAKFLAAAGLVVNATADKIALMTISQGQVMSGFYLTVLKPDSLTDTWTSGALTALVSFGDDTTPTNIIASQDISAAYVPATGPVFVAFNTPKTYTMPGGSAIVMKILGDGVSGGRRPKDAVIEICVAILDVCPYVRGKLFSLATPNVNSF